MKPFWLWFFGRAKRCGAKLDLRSSGRHRVYCWRNTGHPGWHSNRNRTIRWEQ